MTGIHPYLYERVYEIFVSQKSNNGIYQDEQDIIILEGQTLDTLFIKIGRAYSTKLKSPF